MKCLPRFLVFSGLSRDSRPDALNTLPDSNKLIDDYLDLLSWRSSYRYLARIVKILDENRKIVLSVLPNEDMMDAVPEKAGNSDKKAEEDEAAKNKSNLLRVTGSLESFINRLDADYTRSL